MSQILRLEYDDWYKIGSKLYGTKTRSWKFKCPVCNKVQTKQDFIELNMPQDKIGGFLGFSCIGQFNGKGEPFLSGKCNKNKYPDGCDWSLGGFLTLHKLVIIKDGKDHPHFDFADDYLHLLPSEK